MAELNQTLRFTDLTLEERTSFSGSPVLVRLAQGDQLYKWTQYGLIHKGKASPFWNPWSTIRAGGMTAPGFAELRTRYANVGGSVGRPQEFARTRNAVREDWNEMTSITKARLLTPVWGFLGTTRHQPINSAPTPAGEAEVFLIGGDYQLCIPNMTSANIVKL